MGNHHHTLAPSSFPCLAECACFVSGGSSDLSEDTSKGSLLHEYCAGYVKTRVPYHVSGLDASDHEDVEFIVDAAMNLITQQCPGEPVEIEKRVELFDDELNIVTFGTADICTHNEEFAVILDWKGALDYSPESKNYREQLAVYALCEMRKYNLKKALCIEGYIKPRKLFPFWLSYDEAAAIVESIIRSQADPEKKPQPCRFCKWCRDILICPAINNRLATIEKSFLTIPAPEKLLNPETITDPTEMSRALIFATVTMKQYIKRLTQIMDGIEEAAIVMSDKDIEIPDFLRVTKQGRKKIADPQKAFQLSGLDHAQFFTALTVSLPKLAEAYAAANGLTIKEGRKQLEKVLTPAIELEKPNVSLEWKFKG
jgi:hypothetical protein